jgi:hypothetical protein
MVRILWLMKGALRPGVGPPAVAVIVLGTAFLAVNHGRTGSALRTGCHAYWDQGHKWIFPFGPAYTIREISTNLAQLNFWLLGWPVSLPFVPFFARNGRAWAVAAVPIITLIWYGIVGVPTVAAVRPVYYAETIVPLVMPRAVCRG